MVRMSSFDLKNQFLIFVENIPAYRIGKNQRLTVLANGQKRNYTQKKRSEYALHGLVVNVLVKNKERKFSQEHQLESCHVLKRTNQLQISSAMCTKSHD